MTNLVPFFSYTHSYRQVSLFCDTPDERIVKLHQVVDRINHRHGRDKLRLAAQGYDPTGAPVAWKTKQQWVSPCYTTRWKEILVVR